MGTAKAPVSRSRGALLLSLAAALACGACGPAPRSAADADEADAPQAQTVYILVGDPAPGAEDTWIPPEDFGENPFARTRTWVGDYDCPQGNTDLTLRVLNVRGDSIKVLFDFDHIESGASGKYLMFGTYDAQTRRVTFRPGAWIVRPRGYVSVGMTGDVSADGSLFAGRIEYPACSAFRLRPGG